MNMYYDEIKRIYWIYLKIHKKQAAQKDMMKVANFE